MRVHIFVDGTYVGFLTANVITGLPAFNGPPTAALSYTENPATRQVSATVDVTAADAAATEVYVTWHIPTVGVVGPTTVAVGNLPYSDTRNVQFLDASIHDVFAEVTDDVPRYDGSNPGSSAAGDGFQTLLPYFSLVPNLGPDSDGDNTSDILWLHATNGGVFSWQMHGNLIEPRGAVAQLSDLDYRIVGTGDYDGDGKSDIMWLNITTGQMYLWRMDGRTILSANRVARISDPVNWRVIGNGDFNGDGSADLMWRHAVTGQIYYWQMNGATIVASAQVAVNNDANWVVVSSMDGDGDGRADLTWLNNATGQVFFWGMNGASIIATGQIAIVADPNWRNVVGWGDYDGDGRHDLLFRHLVSGKVYYWQMDGSTILLSSRVSVVADFGWNVAGNGDYNGDGFSDVLWYHSGTGEIYHWQQFGFITLQGGQIGFNTDPDWGIVNTR